MSTLTKDIQNECTYCIKSAHDKLRKSAVSEICPHDESLNLSWARPWAFADGIDQDQTAKTCSLI